MSLQTVFSLGMELTVFGFALFSILLIFFFIGYKLVYKKLLKGQKRLPFRRVLWLGIFFCYIVVVLGVTLLIRVGGMEAEPVHAPFYSYRDAWAHWSIASWRIIILNFCMFVPLGFLLPLGLPFFRRASRVFLSGFGFSLFIELTQLITHAGMFEWDDLLGNTVGTMIGYGFYLILAWILDICHKVRPMWTRKMLAAQIPLLVTILLFSVIFLQYHFLELGIHPSTYVTRFPKKLLSVNTTLELSSKKADAMIYQLDVLTPDQAREIGAGVLACLGVADCGRGSTYDSLITTASKDDRYSCWVEFQGGAYMLTDYDTLFPKEKSLAEPVLGASKEEVAEVIEGLGLSGLTALLSLDSTDFQELGNGRYLFKVTPGEAIPAAQVGSSPSENAGAALVGSASSENAGATQNGSAHMGSLSCLYYVGGIAQLENNICSCKSVKKIPLLSEQEAYACIQNGEFDYYKRENLAIQITDCKLIYVADSKGYYQPTYEFTGMINGEENKLSIPAIAKK